MAGWLASCLSFMVSARLSCSSIISACSNNLKQHSTEFTREPCTQINSEMPRLTKGVNYARGGGGGGVGGAAGSEVWNGVYHLSLFGTAASLVSFKLRDFSSDQPAPSLIFFHLQWYYTNLVPRSPTAKGKGDLLKFDFDHAQ